MQTHQMQASAHVLASDVRLSDHVRGFAPCEALATLCAVRISLMAPVGPEVAEAVEPAAEVTDELAFTTGKDSAWLDFTLELVELWIDAGLVVLAVLAAEEVDCALLTLRPELTGLEVVFRLVAVWVELAPEPEEEAVALSDLPPVVLVATAAEVECVEVLFKTMLPFPVSMTTADTLVTFAVLPTSVVYTVVLVPFLPSVDSGQKQYGISPDHLAVGSIQSVAPFKVAFPNL